VSGRATVFCPRGWVRIPGQHWLNWQTVTILSVLDVTKVVTGVIYERKIQTAVRLML